MKKRSIIFIISLFLVLSSCASNADIPIKNPPSIYTVTEAREAKSFEINAKIDRQNAFEKCCTDDEVEIINNTTIFEDYYHFINYQTTFKNMNNKDSFSYDDVHSKGYNLYENYFFIENLLNVNLNRKSNYFIINPKYYFNHYSSNDDSEFFNFDIYYYIPIYSKRTVNLRGIVQQNDSYYVNCYNYNCPKAKSNLNKTSSNNAVFSFELISFEFSERINLNRLKFEYYYDDLDKKMYQFIYFREKCFGFICYRINDYYVIDLQNIEYFVKNSLTTIKKVR